jgi:hypothetical protein
LRFKTRSSNALVLVPNIREKVGLETFAEIWGSRSRLVDNRRNSNITEKNTLKAVDNL